jgi:hypothetical protein
MEVILLMGISATKTDTAIRFKAARQALITSSLLHHVKIYHNLEGHRPSDGSHVKFV